MTTESISCIVEELIYTNEDNGYTVLEATYDDGSDYFTAVGVMPCISEGQNLKLYGNWITHNDYGEQFKVESYELIVPTDEDAILRYLSSGIVEGVREATAKKIIKEFGANSLKVIAEEPERLAEIKGISFDRAMRISESYKSMQSMQSIVVFLQQYNWIYWDILHCCICENIP